MNVIQGQSYLLTSTLDINLNSATVVVRYLLPLADISTVKEIPATIDLVTNSISALVTSTINNTLGKYLFWLYITYPDGTVYKSKPIVVMCIPEGQI
jgi:hypothetical protein